MQILNRVLAALDVPRSVHVLVEIIGWGVLAFCVAAFITIIAQDVIKKRREGKLDAEIKVNPNKAYQQILNQEKLIAEFDDKEAKRQTERRQVMVEKLVKLEGGFIENFPFIKVETVRAYAEKRDHVKR